MRKAMADAPIVPNLEIEPNCGFSYFTLTRRTCASFTPQRHQEGGWTPALSNGGNSPLQQLRELGRKLAAR